MTLDDVWRAAVPNLRVRKNDIHVPISFDYAERLLKGHPRADGLVVRLAILLRAIVPSHRKTSQGRCARTVAGRARLSQSCGRGCVPVREMGQFVVARLALGLRIGFSREDIEDLRATGLAGLLQLSSKVR